MMFLACAVMWVHFTEGIKQFGLCSTEDRQMTASEMTTGIIAMAASQLQLPNLNKYFCQTGTPFTEIKVRQYATKPPSCHPHTHREMRRCKQWRGRCSRGAVSLPLNVPSPTSRWKMMTTVCDVVDNTAHQCAERCRRHIKTHPCDQTNSATHSCEPEHSVRRWLTVMSSTDHWSIVSTACTQVRLSLPKHIYRKSWL